MIHLRNPLWHPVVVGVFCLEQKLKESVGDRGFHIAEAAIRPQLRQGGISLADEPYSAFLIDRNRARRFVDGSNQFVVEIRRADAYLRLFQP